MDEKQTAAVPPARVRAQPSPAVLIIYGLVFVGMIAAAVILSARQGSAAQGGFVTVGRTKVRVSVAANDRSRERGLSGKKGLAADEGMLFVFDHKDTYAFWMKDMKFPIDILWITDGAIADLSTDVPVPVRGERLPFFYPKVPVDKVLEVRAGFAKAHGLKVGMPVVTHIDKVKAVR